jgi:hypothetical protein
VLDGVRMSARAVMFSAEWNEDRDYGVPNFDNIFSAMLTIFQCMTTEVS